MGGVVIEHQVDVAWPQDGAVDAAQELQELPGAMAGQALADDHAGFDIERGEQRGGAMALVIVGHGGGAALLQRQPRLGPVQGLYL